MYISEQYISTNTSIAENSHKLSDQHKRKNKRVKSQIKKLYTTKQKQPSREARARTQNKIDQLRRQLRETAIIEAPVITQTKIIETKIDICPYCNTEIREKSVLYNGQHWFHRPCMDKGPIEF